MSINQQETALPSGRTILVVDDNVANLKVISQCLKDGGCRVLTARDGKRALDSAQHGRPDLILLDVMMPEMDGFETCRCLKADESLQKIPVIFMTALAGVDEKLKAFELGAVDYVTKPFQPAEVLARVRTQLNLRELTEELEQKVRQRTTKLEQQITERQKVQTQLQKSEQRYRTLFESAGDAIMIHDLNGRFVAVNNAACERLGYSRYELLQMTPQDIDAPEYKARVSQAILHIQRYGFFIGEGAHVRRDGTIIPVELNSRLTEYDGKPAVLCVIRDITERKHAEQELKKHRDHLEELVEQRTAELAVAKKQAETANAAKSDFLARMSHEIRTPLNAVTGLTHIVLKSDLTDEQRDYLNKVQIASNNLMQVINDILDFSKIEADRMELGHAPFDLDQVLEHLADIFDHQTTQKDLELIFSVAPDVPRMLTGDSGRLAQVLTNLIQNAIKFTPKGEIEVGVTLDTQAEPQTGKTALQFRVRDTGIGIAADEIPTLFESFTQADSYLTRSQEGTGLGLAICQRLVSLMGGRIWAESTSGQGSTFFFTVLLEPQKTQKIQFSLPQNLLGLKALVVDDSATARQVMAGLLHSFGFNVTALDSGEKAISALREASAVDPFQLVLLDWKMPGLDGIETAKRIREMDFKINSAPPATGNRSESVPQIIVLVTAYGSKLLENQIDMAPVDVWLQKPIKDFKLFNTIMNCYGKKVAVAPQTEPQPDARLRDRLAGRRVLVVEDSEFNLEVAVALLEEAGLAVETAENGQVAVDKVSQSPRKYYDAVFMDIQMPIMDGYEATRHIREWETNDQNESSGHRLPIISLTAHAMKGEKEKCLAADMDDYISKPLDEQELHRMLLKWVNV